MGVILFHRHRDEAIEPAVIHKEQMSARNELLAGDIQIGDSDAIDFDDDHACEQTIGVGRGFLDVGNDEAVEARVEAAAARHGWKNNPGDYLPEEHLDAELTRAKRSIDAERAKASLPTRLVP
jgi:hypothetical protein